MKKTPFVRYTIGLICLTVLLSCGSVRHHKMVTDERDIFEEKWRYCQYKWLMCATENGNIRVNMGIEIDSLKKVIGNRESTIDSLKLELRNTNYEFTERRKDW